MGCLDGILSGAKKSAEKAARQALLENMKKGKRPEQIKCIDFLVAPEEKDATTKKKKKGCCGKGSGGMTIEEYCQLVQNKVNELNLKARAIEKIGLDESQISEIPPVAISSFVFKGEGLYDRYSETSIGGEYLFVTNKYTVTWIFFSATQIYTYTYVFDMISDDSMETTRDFFYTDITCIRTEHEVQEAIYKSTKKKCGCFKKAEESYYHNNKHWDTLQITVPNDSYSFFCKTTDTIEQSIQAAKAMIREKKQG